MLPLTTIEHRPGRNSSSRFPAATGMESCGQALPPVRIASGNNVADHHQIPGAGVKFAASTRGRRKFLTLQQCRGRRINTAPIPSRGNPFSAQHSASGDIADPAIQGCVRVCLLLWYCHGATAASRISSAPAPDARRRAPERRVEASAFGPRGMSDRCAKHDRIPSGFRFADNTFLHRPDFRTGASHSGKSPQHHPRVYLQTCRLGF